MALRQLAAGQSPYALINGLFEAAAESTTLGLDVVGTSGLTLAIFGGNVLVGGAVTALANQTALSLTASATNYVELDPTGTGSSSGIRINTSGWTAGYWPLYQITTDGSGITAYTDKRAWIVDIHPRAAISMASDANKTLTQAEARAPWLSITSAVSLSATRNIVLPLLPAIWFVYNGTTGGQSLQFIGATGTGITVANGKRAIVAADGTNIVRFGADV